MIQLAVEIDVVVVRPAHHVTLELAVAEDVGHLVDHLAPDRRQNHILDILQDGQHPLLGHPAEPAGERPMGKDPVATVEDEAVGVVGPIEAVEEPGELADRNDREHVPEKRAVPVYRLRHENVRRFEIPRPDHLAPGRLLERRNHVHRRAKSGLIAPVVGEGDDPAVETPDAQDMIVGAHEGDPRHLRRRRQRPHQDVGEPRFVGDVDLARGDQCADELGLVLRGAQVGVDLADDRVDGDLGERPLQLEGVVPRGVERDQQGRAEGGEEQDAEPEGQRRRDRQAIGLGAWPAACFGPES